MSRVVLAGVCSMLAQWMEMLVQLSFRKTCVYVCVHVQKRASEAPELESCLSDAQLVMWVLSHPWSS